MVLCLNGADTKYVNFIHFDDYEVQLTIDEIFETMQKADDFYEIKTVGQLYILFYKLYRGGYIFKSSSSCTDKGMQVIVSLLKWIDDHYRERITLVDISMVVGLSEKYICRIFKKYTSKTTMDYVNERRIESACSEMSTKSITESVFNCGFNVLSYFCRTFKKYKSTTPSQYKKHLSIK